MEAECNPYREMDADRVYRQTEDYNPFRERDADRFFILNF